MSLPIVWPRHAAALGAKLCWMRVCHAGNMHASRTLESAQERLQVHSQAVRLTATPKIFLMESSALSALARVAKRSERPVEDE